MEPGVGPRSCFVFVVTFLSLSTLPWTTQGQPQPQVLLVTQPEPHYYITKDQPANITCEAYGATSITFTCLGALALPRALTTYQSFDEGRGRTVVRTTLRVRWDEVEGALGAGVEEYWCQCTAQDQDRFISVSSRRAVVSPAFLEKEFQESPISQIVAVGSQTVLTCTPPLGDPVPQVTWRKDGHRVKAGKDDNLVVGADDSLTIVKVRSQDAGTYHCVAKNMAGRTQSSRATLVVEDVEEEEDIATTRSHKDTPKPRSQRAVKKPTFREQPLTDIYITPNQPVTVACAVEGATRMTVRCNNQRIEPNRLVSESDREAQYIRKELLVAYAEVENHINTFQEENFKKDKAYECQCVAWYTDPSLERKWGNVLSDMGKIYLAYLNEDFEIQPDDVTAQVGTSASLQCGVPKGHPAPTVLWVFEQQRLDPDSNRRYTVSADGTLTINNLEYSDEGRYYCVAENSMGIRQSEVGVVRVSAEPVEEVITLAPTPTPAPEHVPTFPANIPDSPVFTQDLEASYFLDENKEAMLVCTVVSADMLTYRCLGDRLQENEQVIDVKSDRASGKRLLTATTIITEKELNSVQDGRDYNCQCVAWYIKAGAWHHNFSNTATILPAYIDSVFMYEPIGGTYNVEDSVEFDCEPPGGQPTPKMIWEKDGQVLDADADDNLEILPDGRLFIDRARVQDSGEYVCVAFNPAGRRSSSPAQLIIYGYEDDTTPKTPATTTTYKPGLDGASTTTEILEDFEISTLKSGRVIPFFTMPYVGEAYIIHDQSALLNCWAVEATALVYICNGERVTPDKERDVYKSVDPESGYSLGGKSIELHRGDVEQFQGPGDFKCHCRAYYPGDVPEDWQFVASFNTTVKVAYIERRFAEEPVAQTTVLGVSTELVCRPPMGVPQPTVHWLKDGYPVRETNNIQVTAEGSLLFEQVTMADSGDYTCVAENIIGSTNSNTVPLEVVEDDASQPEPEGEGEAEGSPEPTGEGEAEGEAEVWDAVPRFLAEPESNYYIIRSRPVTITCEADGAKQINFNCNGESISQSRVHFQEVEAEGYGKVMSASVDISREEVENHNNQYGGNDFHCQCYAKYNVPGQSEAQYVTSGKGYVEVAYLKKMFRQEPFNITFHDGSLLTLPCVPPEGNPIPEVYWTFNGERVQRPVASQDYSYIVYEASAANAGVYVCVASNVANTRKSRPGLVSIDVNGEIVTGYQFTPGPEAEPSSTTSDYDVNWTPEMSPQQKCLQIVQLCTNIMPFPTADQESLNCQNAPRFIECIDQFQRECEGVVGADMLDATITSKDAVENDCNISPTTTSGGVCKELMTCQSDYSKKNVPNADAEFMPMEILCKGIHSFLSCADEAARACKIPQDKPDTSLTDLAEWFEDYCQKVVEERWFNEDCNSFKQCDLPIEQTTVLGDLVQASLWCPYVQNTMKCTRKAVIDCGVGGVEEDLTSLDTLAKNTCMPNEEPDAESEQEGSEDAEEEEVPGGHENPAGEEGEGMTDGLDHDTGKSQTEDGGDDADGSAWTVRASMLLTSLLPVMLIWMTWR